MRSSSREEGQEGSPPCPERCFTLLGEMTDIMHVRYGRRYPLQCPISFTGEHLVGEGTVLNVSLGGWKVVSDQPVQPGSSLALRIALPDQQMPMKVEVAAVRWAVGREFGLECLNIRPDEQARLSGLITSLEMASPV